MLTKPRQWENGPTILTPEYRAKFEPYVRKLVEAQNAIDAEYGRKVRRLNTGDKWVFVMNRIRYAHSLLREGDCRKTPPPEFVDAIERAERLMDFLHNDPFELALKGEARRRREFDFYSAHSRTCGNGAESWRRWLKACGDDAAIEME